MRPQERSEQRVSTQVRLLPSLRVQVDKLRAVTRQSLSDAVEEALREWLRKVRGK